MLIRLEITVKGKVQGVGFRRFTYVIAKRLGLRGYVKNLENGDVYIVVEGDEEIIKKFLEKIKIGPPGSRVEQVNCFEKKYKGEYDDFYIEY
jgi:acylphosphatase